MSATVNDLNSSSSGDYFASVTDLVRDEMALVDRCIRGGLHSDVALINQVSDYIVGGGGKRLRPALHLLCAKAVGYEGSQQISLAAIIEFIHTATLLHDDVVDESELRRGKNTANAVWGNAASVLVGDFLYSRAFQMMVEIDQMAIMRIMSDTTNTIAEGEVMQLLNQGNPDTDEARYLTVIRCKTAKLFEAAARLGAVIHGAPDEIERALANYGMHLGLAFQLADDMLDYAGNTHELGKNLGDDLAEGKPTLPLIHVMREGSQAQRDLVRGAIESDGLQDLGQVIEAIKDTRALEYTRDRALAEAQMASASLDCVPSGPAKSGLITLAELAVSRRS
ncbi:MAG: polyprenyl synthetase family protein [Lysobacterales bacterium]